ncbi:MAG: hypothetical protein DWQ01_04320 [Planctomycetota bacterium]|nr:MAG: hypothetical protein DWQ01_04320 [Planctomycetota bacterium]
MHYAKFIALLLVIVLPGVGWSQATYDATAPGILSDVQINQGQNNLQGQGGRAGGYAWYTLTTPNFQRSRCGGVTTGGKDFWVIGGETPTGLRVAQVEKWTRTLNTWTVSSSSMPSPVSNISGSVVHENGLFYVFGGLESGDVMIDWIQVYDPVADTWSVHPTPMPAARYGVGAANLGGGKILVCGGADLLFAYGDSWIFDVATGTFTAGPPMPVEDFNISITARPNPADGRVYLTGIRTDTYLQIYDPGTASFSIGPVFASGPTSSRAGCGLINIDQHVIIYGGDWLNYRADVEIYDCGLGGGSCVPLVGLDMAEARRSFAYGDTPCPGALASNGFNGAYMQHAEGAR